MQVDAFAMHNAWAYFFESLWCESQGRTHLAWHWAQRANAWAARAPL